MSGKRRLVLVRHATAEPTARGGDEDRELTEQGFDEAVALGAWLSERNLLGDAVVCSPAVRTRQTWATIVEETGHGVLIDMEPSLYNADVEDVLAAIRRASPDVQTLVVIGHAPGIPALASELCGSDGEADILDALNRGFPPGSCAVVGLEQPWAEVALGSGRLEALRSGSPNTA